MKGAHSIETQEREPKGGNRQLAVLVGGLVLLLILVAIAIFLFVTGASLVSTDASEDDGFSVAANTQSEGATNHEEAHSSQAIIESLDEGGERSDSGTLKTLETYTNARFGFSVDVPEGFVLGSEIDEGSGVVLTNNALRMTVTVSGYDNDQSMDLEALSAGLWNGSEDSIVRIENDRVVIYQYDEEYEYFIWAYVGLGSINQMTIRYPLQDDNRDELDASRTLMQGFRPGDLSVAH